MANTAAVNIEDEARRSHYAFLAKNLDQDIAILARFNIALSRQASKPNDSLFSLNILSTIIVALTVTTVGSLAILGFRLRAEANKRLWPQRG